jgi:predicted dienelactone hydrolase
MKIYCATLILAFLFLVGLSNNPPLALADAVQTQPTIDLEPVDESRKRTVPVRIYLPTEKTARPVILYSHGLGGSREMKVYLGKQWSAAGFVCVFLQHAGSDSEVYKSARPRDRFEKLKEAASLQNNQARIADVSFVIDQLEKWVKQDGHPLHQRIDLEHIGMSGHSFGAGTTLAVAGRMYRFRRSFPEPRIDAFLPMSPQTGKGMTVQETFGHLDQPILCMTGTNDTSPIDRGVTAESRASVYDGMPEGDKYLVVFDGAHHNTFGGGETRISRKQNPKHHRAIETLSTKFWQAYLEEDEDAKQWLKSKQPTIENVLDPADRWVWK